MRVLYTVFAEFRGGTYISQVEAEDATSALSAWYGHLKQDDLTSWGLNSQEAKVAVDAGVTPLEGLANVWCTSSSTATGLLLINIVATSTGPI